MNKEASGNTNGFWMPTIEAINNRNFNIDETINKLKKNGIDARVFFWPLSSLGFTGIEKAFDFKYVSEEIHTRALNLPSPLDLKREDCRHVANIILGK